MLVKFISENSVERYKGLVEIEGTVYANHELKAVEQGYKPLVIEEMPEALEGFCPVSYYEDTEVAVYMHWRQEKMPEEEI